MPSCTSCRLGRTSSALGMVKFYARRSSVICVGLVTHGCERGNGAGTIVERRSADCQ